MRIDKVYHSIWHILFDNMTPSEACHMVKNLMTMVGPDGQRRPWSWQDVVDLRTQMIRNTEEVAKRDPLNFNYLAIYQCHLLIPIRLEHLPGQFREVWATLFGDLRTVAEVHVFVNRLMVVGSTRNWESIMSLREEVRRGSRIGRRQSRAS